MARGVDPLVRYAVLGALGWAGWNWANAQPSGSWARGMADQARGAFKATPAHAAAAPSGGGGGDGSGAPASSDSSRPGAVAAAPPVNTDNTVVQQYNQLDTDGNWYQVTQWSDGTWTSYLIPPDQWPNYGIPTGGADGAYQGPPVEAGPGVVQQHDDGQWWLDIPFTDGSVSSTYIDPSQYVMFGILPDGSATNPWPGPI